MMTYMIVLATESEVIVGKPNFTMTAKSSRTHWLTRCFREAYTGLPVVRATENQKALNCVVLKYSIPVSEE